MTFNEYLRDVRRKTHEMANKLVQLTRHTYGTKGALIIMIVEFVVKPTVL